MDDVFNIRALSLMALFSIIVCTCVVYARYQKHETEIVFCDVGQGDAAYLRLANGKDVLIDTGGSQDVLDCLGSFMPPTDTYIDIVIISHPHLDHYGGLPYVLDRYHIGMVIISPYEGSTEGFKKLLQSVKTHHLKLLHGTAGMNIEMGQDIHIQFLWPTDEVVQKKRMADDANAYSIVILYEEGEFDALFTGDVSLQALAYIQSNPLFQKETIEVLKVPHHGSDNGLTEEFLKLLQPSFSVISVGKQNRYGHPSPEIIDMYQKHKLPYALTSKQGNIPIRVRSDGTFSQ